MNTFPELMTRSLFPFPPLLFLVIIICIVLIYIAFCFISSLVLSFIPRFGSLFISLLVYIPFTRLLPSSPVSPPARQDDSGQTGYEDALPLGSR